MTLEEKLQEFEYLVRNFHIINDVGVGTTNEITDFIKSVHSSAVEETKAKIIEMIKNLPVMIETIVLDKSKEGRNFVEVAYIDKYKLLSTLQTNKGEEVDQDLTTNK